MSTEAKQVKVEITIVQARPESYEVSDFRIFMVLALDNGRHKSFAFRSMFEAANHFNNHFHLSQWPAIERSLAVDGAWKNNVELSESAANAAFSNIY